MMSLINSINSAEIQEFPFPHIEIENALPDDEYQIISKNFPDMNTFIDSKPYRENFRYNIFANELLAGNYHESIKKFVKIHSSFELYYAILMKFKSYYISLLGESLFYSLLDESKVGLRKQDSFKEYDVLLDSTFAINTPNNGGNTSVRGPHIDKLFKLYGGLYYLRKENDSSEGGDLILYKYKNCKHIISSNDDSSTSPGARVEISPENVEEIKRVKYSQNKLILYPNGINAIHAVSIRSKTDTERRIITLVADYKSDILDIN